MYKKGISLFSVETSFFPTVPKNIVRGTIKGFRNVPAWKVFMQKKGISPFSVGTFFSYRAEKFREGNHSVFQKYSGMEKFYAEEGDIIFFCWNFFFLKVSKKFVGGIIQRFRNIRVSKTFMHRNGLSLFSVETTFFSQCRKISWEELFNV